MPSNDSTPDVYTDSRKVIRQTLRHAMTEGFGFKEQLPEALKYLLIFQKEADKLIISAKAGEIFATLSKASDEEYTQVIEAADLNSFFARLSRHFESQEIVLHNAEPHWINVPMLRHHSLDGVPEAGYSGSGPADTALSILAYLLPIEGPRTPEELRVQFGLPEDSNREKDMLAQLSNAERERLESMYYEEWKKLPARIYRDEFVSKEVWEWHQEFKEQVLAAAPEGMLRLSVPQIQSWIQAKRAGRRTPKVDVRHD